ncbi:MAG: hypothetical protein ISS71_09770 [Phycisphaerae bacterium]|nr:hypothetical protein [Phycisphaerae bacterium]
MKNHANIVKTIFKIILGIVLGLVFSFVTIVCLEITLPKPNPFRKDGLNLWLVGPLIAAWLFFMLWLILRRPSSKNIQTQGIEHLPESVSELIDAIIDTMRYRKSVRAEVRQELTDHFTDALKNCENEQQKQERIKELIEAFGDVELLATLIRRGKKRCQPLWRKILTHIPHTIGVLILLLVFYLGWFFTGKPEISRNYLEVFNQQVRPVADENQNAWPYYEQAAQNYVKSKVINIKTGSLEVEAQEQHYDEENFIKFDDSPRSLEKLSQEQRQILEQWLSDNRQVLDLALQGNQKPYCWRNYSCGEETPTEMIGVLIPNLSVLKGLGRLLCWQGLTEAHQGEFEKAGKSLCESYTHHRSCCRSGWSSHRRCRPGKRRCMGGR